MSNPPLTAPSKGHILVIDDEADIRESLEFLLTGEGFRVDLATRAMEGLDKLSKGSYDLILLDLMMPDLTGIETLAEIRKKDGATPVFLLTAYGSIEVAVEALKAGANDYFSKPWDNEKLVIEIDRMIAASHLARENVELKRALKQRYSFSNIIGKSERMLKLLDMVTQVAPSRANILISGEAGTGRELVAKSIHANSTRADRAFVTVNTSSLPSDVLDSALFGIGLAGAKKPYLELANGGTLFIDEVTALTADMQAGLLHAIQEREFTPPSGETIALDIRVLAATSGDLRKAVEEGKFRDDLYYRLNVVHLPMPALRDRKEDIPLLIEHFANLYSTENGKLLGPAGRSLLRFDSEAMQILMDHNWPGNVRELENVVERAIVLSSEAEVNASLLPEHLLQAGGVRIRKDESEALPADASLYEIVADFERKVIMDHLDRTNWSQTEAAETLRIPLSTLNQKIKRLAINVKKR
ncbi:sigma-54-dependent transcriptional regulator [Bryobacter aggregatus]|uniref:sigma-54-dependent transcriptional regulator n=1 Tax=Bryobacter aggregatus TaxID=360054 RepID=UPI0004E0C1AA|nr:sigma-54 dependent transcriptional regulator [Bryobacter aggregatus]